MLRWKMFAALVLTVFGGCQIVSDPPKKPITQNVEFLRGCWVSKAGPEGSITAFLRLLPEGADGLNYQGYFQPVLNGQMRPVLHLSFTRDGSSLTLRNDRGGPTMPLDEVGGAGRPYARLPDAVTGKLPKAEHRASYAVYGGSPTTPWFVADGGSDTLDIYSVSKTGVVTEHLFRGERDGCD